MNLFFDNDLTIANLGAAYYTQGNHKLALEHLNRAIDLDLHLKWAITLRDKIQQERK